MNNVVVVAIGGNAILSRESRGSADEQYESVRRACVHLVPLIRVGCGLVIVHGNGPQVGNLLVQQLEASSYVPELPVSLCVAMTQGQIGAMLAQGLAAELRRHGLERQVAAIVTQVRVDPHDEDFQLKSKPIGPWMDERLKARYDSQPGETIRYLGRPPRPYRRVVASPQPLEVVESAAVRALLQTGFVVIAGGGGGVPVALDQDGSWRPVEAVVDKDFTARVLAQGVGAETLLILTDVPGVALDFGRPPERYLSTITTNEARAFLEAGQFAPGSMGPKVRACVQFVEESGRRAIVANLEQADAALNGQAGTRFLRE